MNIAPSFQQASEALTQEPQRLVRLRDHQLSGDFLKKLVDVETVRPFTDADDVMRRVFGVRRDVYALMRGDDVDNSVQVALTQGRPAHVQNLTEGTDTVSIEGTDTVRGDPDTAVFYSIQVWPGRKGDGRALIRQAAVDIAERNPSVVHFVTISPLNGLRDWVISLKPQNFLKDRLFECLETPTITIPNLAAQIQTRDDLERHPAFKRDLARLAARYVLTGETTGERFRSLNAVAGFHLGGGAQADLVLPDGDLSEAAMAQSFGLQMSYRYKLADLAANRAAYNQGRPAVSAEVTALFRPTDKKVGLAQALVLARA